MGPNAMQNTLRLLACLAFAFATAPALGAVSQEAAEQLRQAEQHRRRGEHRQAIDTLEALLENEPALAEAHRLLGHAYLGLGRTDDARAALIDAIEHGRPTGDVLAALIRIDRQAGGRDAALLTTAPLMHLREPDNPIWFHLWAEALDGLDQPDAAAGVLHALTREHPDDPRGWLALANAQLASGDSPAAAASFETAWHLGAEEPGLALTLARLHRQLDDPHASLAWYDRALADAAEGADRDAHLLEQAQMQVAAGLTVERSALERLAEGDDRQSARRAADLLAQVSHRDGEVAQGVAWWRLAVEHGLDRPQVLALLGSHHINRGEHELAAPFLQQHLANHRTTETDAVRRMLIVSLIELGERDQAREHLRAHVGQHGLDEAADQLIDQLVRTSER